jgi:poly(glycerol-phosphate) alpha-glucosyltransferase
MAVLEAWAHAKPVVITPQCNLPEGFAAQAAIRIEPNLEAVIGGLQKLFRTNNSNLGCIGSRGRSLVESRFAWPKIISDLTRIYAWAAGSGPKPECVQTH